MLRTIVSSSLAKPLHPFFLFFFVYFVLVLIINRHTRSFSPAELLIPFVELERELHRRVREGAMGEPLRRTLSSYVKPTLASVRTGINRPATTASFTIPPAITNMIHNNVQFDGLADEDPSDHTQIFMEVCHTFKIQGMTDAIKLSISLFSANQGKELVKIFSSGSVNT
jgi:hypothetical protein